MSIEVKQKMYHTVKDIVAKSVNPHRELQSVHMVSRKELNELFDGTDNIKDVLIILKFLRSKRYRCDYIAKFNDKREVVYNVGLMTDSTATIVEGEAILDCLCLAVVNELEPDNDTRYRLKYSLSEKFVIKETRLK